MKLNYIKRKGVLKYSVNCGNYMRFGTAYCFSPYIVEGVKEIILADIRDKTKLLSFDTDVVRK